MKIKTSALIALSAFCLSASSVLADFTFNPITLASGDPAHGVIWFDTLGTMSYDVNDNPTGVSGGTLANQTVKVDFLFFVSGVQVGKSQTYVLDTGSFGTVSGRGIETVSSVANLAGQTGTYQVEAWLGGSTYGDPLNTKRNVSAGGDAIGFGGTPLVGAPATPGSVNNFANFAIVSVPEPTTLALGLFGAAGLLIRRRTWSGDRVVSAARLLYPGSRYRLESRNTATAGS